MTRMKGLETNKWWQNPFCTLFHNRERVRKLIKLPSFGNLLGIVDDCMVKEITVVVNKCSVCGKEYEIYKID
jgi:hypothetical protein